MVGFLLSLGLLVLLADTFLHANWVAYRPEHYVRAFFRLMLNALIRPVGTFAPPLPGEQTQPANPVKPVLRQHIAPVLRGLVIAVPIVAILGTLLASGDAVFADSIKTWLNFFDIDHIGEYIFRLFYICILAFQFTGVYLHAIAPSHTEERPTAEASFFQPFLGWTESTVVLVCVNLLFLAFVVIQFRYLFGGLANINISGFTYADYARRGFNEMVAVALLSLGLYAVLAAVTQLRSKLQRSTFTTLLAMVGVMLASAFQRLALYESAYGFTQLRTYTHVFIPWLGLLLLATAILEIVNRRHQFGLALFSGVMVFGLLLGIFNVDGFIVEQNVARAQQTQKFDASYFAVLSADAVPALVAQYQRSDLPKDVHTGLGVELACRTARMNDAPNKPWQSCNLSETNARNLLSSNADLWKEFPVQFLRTYQVKVNGVDQTCPNPRLIMD
jgi:hypothetical protein